MRLVNMILRRRSARRSSQPRLSTQMDVLTKDALIGLLRLPVRMLIGAYCLRLLSSGFYRHQQIVTVHHLP